MLSKKILTQTHKPAEVLNSNSTKQKNLVNDNCVNFTSDEYLQIGGTNNTFALGTNPYTVIAWFKPYGQISVWFTMGAFKDNSNYWYINASSFILNTVWGISISSKASGSNKETHAYTAFGVAPPLDVTTGNWNMLALSSNRVDATSCILNDTTVNLTNTSFSTDNISPTDHTSASKYTKIGRYRSSTSATSTVNNTDMKSVAFFDKYMTVDELKQLYLEGYNANYETGEHASNLKDWYRFGNRNEDRFPYISNRIALGDRPHPEVTNDHFRNPKPTANGIVGWEFNNALGGSHGITHDNTNKWIVMDGTAYDRIISDSIKAGPGEVYEITTTFAAGGGGNILLYLGNVAYATVTAGAGTFTHTVQATTSDPRLAVFVPPGSGTVTISSMTCKLLDPNLIRPGLMVNGEASDIKRGTGKVVDRRFD
tara:strand:+ start:4322 stop:5599 length:1278 start_codon:yes stop_codon:yes gene_type:complete